MLRSTPLRRGQTSLRKVPLRQVNHVRRKRLYEAQFGDYAEAIRNLPCAACHSSPPSDPHHVRSRGAGGTKRDLVPLCRECHSYGHQHGWSALEELYGINLRDIADELWRQHGG